MRSKRMKPIAHHAEQKEQDAVRLFVKAQQDLKDVEDQLQQLLGYREEYASQLTTQSGRSIEHIRNFQAFIEKVTKAIDQAKIEIENKKQVCERYRLAWMKCRSRSKALNLVVEKYQLEEFRQQERNEQKEQDEHSARIGGNKADQG